MEATPEPAVRQQCIQEQKEHEQYEEDEDKVELKNQGGCCAVHYWLTCGGLDTFPSGHGWRHDAFIWKLYQENVAKQIQKKMSQADAETWAKHATHAPNCSASMIKQRDSKEDKVT